MWKVLAVLYLIPAIGSLVLYLYCAILDARRVAGWHKAKYPDCGILSLIALGLIFISRHLPMYLCLALIWPMVVYGLSDSEKKYKNRISSLPQ